MRFQDSALASLAVLATDVAFASNSKISGDHSKGALRVSGLNTNAKSYSSRDSGDLLLTVGHDSSASHNSQVESNALVSGAWAGQMQDGGSHEKDASTTLSIDVGAVLMNPAKPSESGIGMAPSALSDPEEWTDHRDLGYLDCEVYCSGFEEIPMLTDASLDEVINSCANSYSNLECPYPDVPITCWNVNGVTNMTGAFEDLSYFNSPLECWDVSNVVYMVEMFADTTSFNQPLESWNTANVVEMESMFYSAEAFNQPLGSWNTAKVTEMDYMFNYALNFNQPLNSWDVSKVTEMDFMFAGSSFNQPLDNWDVSNVKYMQKMFREATSFDQALGSWNTAKVYSMDYMFRNATYFNQPLNNWDVSQVTDMEVMFYGALSFNQPLGSWDTANVVEMDYMFYGAMSFNQPLNSWIVSKVTDMENMFRSTPFNQPLASWDVGNVMYLEDMFRNTTDFNQPLDDWDVSRVVDMKYMFYNAGSFIQCLDSWSKKTSETDITVVNIFEGSACTYPEGPTSGIWCSDECDGVQDVCQNDDEFLWNGKNKKDCKWVSKNLKRCKKKDKPSGKKINFFCPLHCNKECQSNPAPTLSPTWDPAKFCDRDSKDFALNGIVKKNCNWASKKPDKNCNLKDKESKIKVKEFCPSSCDLSCLCKDSKKPFKTGGSSTKCKQLESTELCTQEATSKAFEGSTVADFCPKKCDSCLLK